MTIYLNRLSCISVFVLLLCCPSAKAQTDSNETPTHLALARELVENIKPENNRYSLGEDNVSFPGDFFSNKYSMRADCSGFLIALLERAKYSTRSQMSFLNWAPGRKKFKSEDFLYSIESEKGFKRIKSINDIRPGDVLAIELLNAEDKNEAGVTGHVALINSSPRKIPSRKPVVEGTSQFEVSLIDSNQEPSGEDDTRVIDSSNKIQGLGRGTVRLYADSDGEVVGFARTFKNSNRFFSYTPRFPSDTKLRKAAIGRPIAGN
jgi:hypothetical protein